MNSLFKQLYEIQENFIDQAIFEVYNKNEDD